MPAIIDLGGAWEMRAVEQEDWLQATVPGCVHTDLMAAGRIPDPYYRDDEEKTRWIGRTDWVYRRHFEVPADWLERERVIVQCQGLDTLATLRVNGIDVGQADNQFRTWEFDVTRVIQAGDNTIEIFFLAPIPYCESRERYPRPPQDIREHAGDFLRKSACNFGWDWGPRVTTCGICQPLRLVAVDPARVTDLRIRQDHAPQQVTLTVDLTIEQTDDRPLQARFRVGDAEQLVPLTDGAASAELVIENPRLWWPNGLGDQPLYTVESAVLDGDAVLDSTSRRIGLRTLRLERERDPWGESFRFAVNGVAFFAKGANWIPADSFPPRVTEADYRRLVGDAAAANMNMLRVWGGGIYEPDIFYDICDELGICVWQDFMFACSTYPADDDGFMANVKVEAEENVRRLRHHPSIALWCGNNELEQGFVGEDWGPRTMPWADYERLFDHLLAEVVVAEDGERDYWPGSPHTPHGDRREWNDPTCGDAHLWSVWHGKQPFEWYRTCTHRFNSEFGFQSFPEPQTVATYTAAADRNVTSPIMEHHQRSGIGNATIMHYMLDWFRLPVGFENTLWVSQIQQGMAIKYAVEHWRRSMPRGMGTLYWQINDCWPVASWASIDSLGRWKALHYMARQFFAPLLISGLEDSKHGTVEIHVTSDRLDDVVGGVRWLVTDTAGAELETGSTPVIVAARCNARVRTLDLSGLIAKHGAEKILVWLELEVDGECVSDNLVLFARPKHLELPDPNIAVDIAEGAVTLTAQAPALWAWLELPGGPRCFGDNFIHLRPGRPRRLAIDPDADTSDLRVRSLVDTFREV